MEKSAVSARCESRVGFEGGKPGNFLVTGLLHHDLEKNF
jgi:hypothetical protein